MDQEGGQIMINILFLFLTLIQLSSTFRHVAAKLLAQVHPMEAARAYP